jgi:branched-chain amino acid transport system substrate-binding protein
MPMLQGVQTWAKSVNSQGGLNGHEVRILVYDDGGDGARYRAAIQNAVEAKKVIAFVQMGGGLHGESGSVQYLTDKRIPVIGSEGVTAGFYQSPMYFPQASHHHALVRSWVYSTAEQVLPKGKSKLGLLYCAESPECTEVYETFAKTAESVGLQVVHHSQASIAQPDFTADCLAARNAGVEVLFIVLVSSTINRVADSCGRQSYHPIFAAGASIIDDAFKSNTNLDGFVGSSQVFPYFQAGTEATDEFQAAMRRFGGSAVRGLGSATGWTSGKLLEKAGGALPEPPTSDALLRGLWSLRDESLGGITQSVTFEENKPARPMACWFNIALVKGSWISPDGFERRCKP